jgi:hypothetical protein
MTFRVVAISVPERRVGNGDEKVCIAPRSFILFFVAGVYRV